MQVANAAALESVRPASAAELATSIAHEINNPLAAILGLAEFLLEELEPGTRTLERVQQIHKAGLEIREVVHSLLAHARERPDGPGPGTGGPP
jgi:signal transduction histidine kinase